MGLLDGGAAAIFSAAFSGFYLDGQIHRKSPAEEDDGEGGGANLAFLPDEPVKAQLDKVVERVVDGVADRYQRIIVLQKVTIAGVVTDVDEMTTDDEITVGGTRWTIALVEQDPAKAYFDLAGRVSGIEAS